MNFVIISFDDLRYDALTCNGNKKIQTNVFDSIAKQGVCFHNFRLPSPVPRENINYIINHLEDISVEKELVFYDDYNEFIHSNDFIPDNIHNKDDFILWRHCNDAPDIVFADYNSYVLYLQEKARSLIDYLDENGYINDRTVIVLMGMSGHPKLKRSKIFQSERTLYDDSLHVPLVVFHPDLQARDITNSVSLEVLANTLKTWIDPTFTSENTFLELCQIESGVCEKRWDIYSRHLNTAGLRGPMFQYYCDFDKDGNVTNQELFDLNNDYKMENDLVVHSHNLNTQIVDLINTYRKRVINRFC